MLRNRLLSTCLGGAVLAAGWMIPAAGRVGGELAWADAFDGETGPRFEPSVIDAPGAKLAAQPVNLLAPLPPDLETLKIKLRRTLGMYHAPRLNTRDHNTWEMMHAIIAYGINSEVRNGGPTGPALNSIGCLCFNYPCKSQQLFYLDQGRVEAKKGVGVQGHPGQFLAIVAQSHLHADYPMLVEGKKFTVADLIESEQRGCQHGMELTFKLIALSHYLDPSATWRNAAGEEWSISQLIHEEIKSPINGVACGGTHRLMGLSYAVRKRGQHGQPIDGEFRRAKIYTEDFHRYTLGLQNSDGSLSTEWFVSRGARPDRDRRLQTTGHILEWLAFSLPEEELRDPRIMKAADYLAGLLLSAPQQEWEIGPLGHALHGLALYDERLFKAHEEKNRLPVAEKAAPAPKKVANKPGVPAATTVPGRLPSVDEPLDAEAATRPEPAAVAKTEVSPPTEQSKPRVPVATAPAEKSSPAPVVEPAASPKAKRTPLAPQRGPAWRR